ncbi:MAG: hypothetical protein LR015_01495 [Verrucomicrobia bacterium]|nr:hypothetical protein [Verrucomicrobiota bacterium]
MLIYRDFLASNLPIFLPSCFYYAAVVGLIYELRKGALEWDK